MDSLDSLESKELPSSGNRALRNPHHTGNRRTSGFLAAFSFVGVLWILWILWNPKNSRARETGPLDILIIREIAILRVFWRRFPLNEFSGFFGFFGIQRTPELRKPGPQKSSSYGKSPYFGFFGGFFLSTGPLEILVIREIAVLRVFWRRFPFYRSLRNPRHMGNRRASGFLAAFSFVGVRGASASPGI